MCCRFACSIGRCVDRFAMNSTMSFLMPTLPPVKAIENLYLDANFPERAVLRDEKVEHMLDHGPLRLELIKRRNIGLYRGMIISHILMIKKGLHKASGHEEETSNKLFP
jgi:hypothetical protein